MFRQILTNEMKVTPPPPHHQFNMCNHPFCCLRSFTLLFAGICHHLPFLIAMLVVFCGKKHWVPFFPTLPVCFVLMCACVVVIPSFVTAGVTLSVITIYGVISLNGFCAGLSQSLVSRVIVLFPGGKSNMLIHYGNGKQ